MSNIKLPDYGLNFIRDTLPDSDTEQRNLYRVKGELMGGDLDLDNTFNYWTYQGYDSFLHYINDQTNQKFTSFDEAIIWMVNNGYRDLPNSLVGRSLILNRTNISGSNVLSYMGDISRPPQPGRAESFDGTNYVNHPDKSEIQLTDAITIFVRLRQTSLALQDVALKGTSATVHEWYLYLDLTGKTNIKLNNAAITHTGDTSITANTVTSIAFTYDKSNIISYLNGTPDGSTAYTSAISLGSYDIQRSNGFIGENFELLIYNRALSASEIQDLHDGKLISSGRVRFYDCSNKSLQHSFDKSSYKDISNKVNWASGNNYESYDVPKSWQNDDGYTNIKMIETDLDIDIIGHNDQYDYDEGDVITIRVEKILTDNFQNGTRFFVSKSNQYGLRIEGNGRLRFEISGIALAVQDTTVLQNNKLYESISVTYDTVNDLVTYYINDVQSSQVAFSSSPNTATDADLYIGGTVLANIFLGIMGAVEITINSTQFDIPLTLTTKEYLPRLESEITKDIFDQSLQYRGFCSYPMSINSGTFADPTIGLASTDTANLDFTGGVAFPGSDKLPSSFVYTDTPTSLNNSYIFLKREGGVITNILRKVVLSTNEQVGNMVASGVINEYNTNYYSI